MLLESCMLFEHILGLQPRSSAHPAAVQIQPLQHEGPGTPALLPLLLLVRDYQITTRKELANLPLSVPSDFIPPDCSPTVIPIQGLPHAPH